MKNGTMKRKNRKKMWRDRRKAGSGLLLFVSIIVLVIVGLFRKEADLDRFGPYPVERIVDGDTFIATIDGKSEKIRLIGVDAPESVHPDQRRNTEEGKEVSKYVKNLLENRGVYLEYDVSMEDQYDRVLAYVYLEDGKTMLNELLLEEGYAAVMTVQPNSRYADHFYELQKKSQEEKKGIWGN